MLSEKELARFQKEIVQNIVNLGVEHGDIDPKNKSAEELQKEIKAYLDSLLRRKPEIRFVMDYREDLLEEARRYSKLGSNQIACLFYAIWFEHWANSLIVALGTRKKMEEKEIGMMIRELSFHGKLALIPALFGLPRLKKIYVDKILRLVELRNSFVHYKWQGQSQEFQDQHDEEINQAILNIGNVVKYLKSYHSRHLYHGKKHLVKKSL